MSLSQTLYTGAILFFICIIGFYLAYVYGRKTKKFRWREYFAIILLPIACVAYLVYETGFKLLVLFVISSITGFFLEYIVGLTYHKTLNSKLWEYKRLSIQGYTSLLSIPVWGIAGVVFYFLSKIIGL